MKLVDLKTKIQEYQYLEDTNIIDVVLASILCTRLGLGAPVWLTIIGASSGGKTQILRPLAMTDEKFIHVVDDLTPNTLLSGANIGKGKDPSLLTRIGRKGIIVIPDLTLLFSKESSARDEIFGAFRMMYDGYYTKNVGNKGEALTWKGEIGILAGSTPTIYSRFEEIADMGERFIYYRMKEYDSLKATKVAMNREIYGDELNKKLCSFYTEYLQGVMQYHTENDAKELPEAITERIMRVAVLTERVRTTSHVDWQRNMDKLPVPAMPMRIALQMKAIARGLSIMRQSEGQKMGVEDFNIIDWCGYSLANEEKRACLRILAGQEYNHFIKTQTVADFIGLDTTVVRILLQNLSAIGVLTRHGNVEGLTWKIASKDDWDLIREIENIVTEEKKEDRALSAEEVTENDDNRQRTFYELNNK